MSDLSVMLCGKKLKNPVITASGTFGFGREFDEIYDISCLGGVATKGIALVPWGGNPVPRIAESRGVILNAVGLQKPRGRSFHPGRPALAAGTGHPHYCEYRRQHAGRLLRHGGKTQ